MLVPLMLIVAALGQADRPVADPQVAEPAVIEDVVVTGQEPKAIESFVDALTIPRRAARPWARSPDGASPSVSRSQAPSRL